MMYNETNHRLGFTCLIVFIRISICTNFLSILIMYGGTRRNRWYRLYPTHSLTEETCLDFVSKFCKKYSYFLF